MRIANRAGLAIAVSVAGLTIGYSRRAQEGRAAAPVVVPPVQTTTGPTGDPALDCPDAKPAIPLVTASIPEVSATQELDGIRVKGKAVVAHRQEGTHFFWVVRIARAEGYRFGAASDPARPCIVAPYADKTFTIPPDEEAELSFDEAIFPQLPPGKYCVELHLVHLFPGLTPQIIRDDDHMMNLVMAGNVARDVELE